MIIATDRTVSIRVRAVRIGITHACCVNPKVAKAKLSAALLRLYTEVLMGCRQAAYLVLIGRTMTLNASNWEHKASWSTEREVNNTGGSPGLEISTDPRRWVT